MEQMDSRIHKTIRERVKSFSIREDSLRMLLASYIGTIIMNHFGEQIFKFIADIALWIIKI